MNENVCNSGKNPTHRFFFYEKFREHFAHPSYVIGCKNDMKLENKIQLENIAKLDDRANYQSSKISVNRLDCST